MPDWKPKQFFTEAEVDAAMTAKGGFSHIGLAKLGVPWPPPKGWRRAITKRAPMPPRTVLTDDPRKRRPSQWITLNPMFKYAFTAKELELDTSPLKSRQ